MKKILFSLSAIVLTLGMITTSCKDDEKFPPLLSELSYIANGLGPTAVSIKVQDDNGAMQAVSLHYRTQRQSTFTKLDMTGPVDGKFSANLPALSEGDSVFMYVAATNAANLSSVFPAGAPQNLVFIIITEQSTPPAGLYVNEIFANGTKDDSDPDWVEIFNASSTAVDLGGYYIQDDTTKESAKRYIKSGIIVPANGFVRIYTEYNNTQVVDGTGSFGLSTSGGDGVRLVDANGNKVNELRYANIDAASKVFSYGRKPDGSNSAKFIEPTPGASNNNAADGIQP